MKFWSFGIYTRDNGIEEDPGIRYLTNHDPDIIGKLTDEDLLMVLLAVKVVTCDTCRNLQKSHRDLAEYFINTLFVLVLFALI